MDPNMQKSSTEQSLTTPVDPNMQKSSTEQSLTTPSVFNPAEREQYLRRICKEFGSRLITKVSEEDLRCLSSSYIGRLIGHVSKSARELASWAMGESLVQAEEELVFLSKIYRKLSKLDLQRIAPDGIRLP